MSQRENAEKIQSELIWLTGHTYTYICTNLHLLVGSKICVYLLGNMISNEGMRENSNNLCIYDKVNIRNE